MDFGTIIDAALSSALGPDAIVFALAAIGLNIHFGYTGLLNFGRAGFMAVGAYGLAVSVVTWDLPFWVGIGVAFLAPVGLAIVLGVRHCACARTTSRSPPSRPPRSSASSSERSRPKTSSADRTASTDTPAPIKT